MTGLRFSAGDSVALAAALIRLFSMPEPARTAIGARGRAWVTANFNAPAAAEPTLAALCRSASGTKPLLLPAN